MEVLIAFEDGIFHNLPHNIFQLTNSEVEILISISRTLPQVEALNATIINSFGHTLMQIRVDVLGVKIRMLKHSNDLFQLCSSPPAVCTWFERVQTVYVCVCTKHISMYLVCTCMYLHNLGMYWN